MCRVLIITVLAMLAIVVAGCFHEDQPPINTPVTDDLSKRQIEHPLVTRFVDADWDKAYDAANALQRQPKIAIPLLIELLSREEHVKLQNTADLIYPGADTFHGHGSFINYDLDWLSVRAGWLLEEITFQNFGFSEDEINHDELLTAAIAGKRDVPLNDVVEIKPDPILRKKRRSKSIARAKAWWQSNQTNWTRLAALSEALRSKNSHSISKALMWIKHGEIPIEGFNRELYVKDIYPIVQKLTQSPDEEISWQAKDLVKNFEDDEWYWYRLKTDQDKLGRW